MSYQAVLIEFWPSRDTPGGFFLGTTGGSITTGIGRTGIDYPLISEAVSLLSSPVPCWPSG